MFDFPDSSETLTPEQICESLARNYCIRITPNELEDAWKNFPDHEFFKIMKMWPWIMSDKNTSNRVGIKIREAAEKIGFSVGKI